MTTTVHLPLLNDVVKSVNVRLATPEDDSLQRFSFSSLSAINVCPTWGMIHSVNNLVMPGAGRAMALEAGKASHEFYKAVRIYDLMHYQGWRVLAYNRGAKLFSENTWSNMCAHLESDEDQRTEGINFALQALYDSGFYDDPYDKRRTMTNIEEACIAYYDRWPWGKYPIWIEDESDPTSRVGIEIGFRLVIEFTLHDGTLISYLYRGLIDGLHRSPHRDNHLFVEENKTASRLDKAWSMSFLMSHQVTGYCVAASLFAGEPCDNALVKGMAIPLPRGYDYGGLVDEPVTREPYLIGQWLQWVWDTTRVYEQFKDNPDAATRFTHSCNRYFRPCSLLPYCASDDEERTATYKEFEPGERSPLDDKTQD